MWSYSGNFRVLTNLHICLIYFPIFESGAILTLYWFAFQITPN